MRSEWGRAASPKAKSAVVAVLALAAALAALAWPGGARAALVGSDLQGAANPSAGYGCGEIEPCAVQQIALPDGTTRVPFRGIIRRWRFRTTYADVASYALRLRVLRKASPGKWRFVGRSKLGTVPPDNGKYVFKTRLKVRRGDTLALELPKDFNVRGFYLEDVAGARVLPYFPAPPNGTVAAPGAPEQGVEALFNASVRRRR